MSSEKILEIACFNLESALLAQSNGANRIELCDDYAHGGLTPSYQVIQEARKQIHLPLHVIIRLSWKSFVYSETEKQMMREKLMFCKENKIDGIVFGALTQNNKIDIEFCRELISLARPLSICFHRAIDECDDLNAAINSLIVLGVDRVLTSGGKGSAESNIEVLKKLQKQFEKQIHIMPGGGIRSTNLAKLMNTGCSEFHSAAITNASPLPNVEEITRMKQVLIKGS